MIVIIFDTTNFIHFKIDIIMKSNLSNMRHALMLFFLLCGFVLFSQTREQSRVFVSKTHIALAKIEKEMYYSKSTTFESELKKAIKFQLMAVKLYKEAKYFEAVGYSLKSRSLSIEICKQMNISEGNWYNLNDEEKAYCDPSKYTNMNYTTDQLSPELSKTVEDLDLLNPQKFHELELGNLK